MENNNIYLRPKKLVNAIKKALGLRLLNVLVIRRD